MTRVRTFKGVVVLYAFAMMVFAGAITSLLILALFGLGLLRFPFVTPLLNLLAALLASVVIGTTITALAGERILKPLNDLIRATKVVARGDFSVRVEEIEGDNEVAELLRNFNLMAKELGGIELFRNGFIDDFSHEFRTPIASIHGFAERLAEEELPDEERREYARIIARESERLSKLATSVLLLSKLENQQIVTDRADYDLDEQLRDCVILLEKDWSAKGLGLELELEPTRIRADQEMLSRVWLNLLDNAIKFSPEKGRIRVRCGPVLSRGAGEGKRGILVSIGDEGEGMDEATKKRIFDKFFQGDGSRATSGNGLGLPIATRIVSLCKGRIEVESAPGQGSTFRVYLPE
jgi:signal transduction histidine kinase